MYDGRLTSLVAGVRPDAVQPRVAAQHADGVHSEEVLLPSPEVRNRQRHLHPRRASRRLPPERRAVRGALTRRVRRGLCVRPDQRRQGGKLRRHARSDRFLDGLNGLEVL